MRVLIACEFSGITRQAFEKKGHYVLSCDLLPSEIPGNHYQGDVFDIINEGWDLMIGFPPCTDLATSGNRWLKYKKDKILKAISFFKKLYSVDIPLICLENSKGLLSSMVASPSQIVYPYQFGCNFSKGLCLWLKNLPLLQVRFPGIYRNRFPGIQDVNCKNRSSLRSRSFKVIAEAMAEQWSNIKYNQLVLF